MNNKTHNLKIINSRKLPFLQYIKNGLKKAEGRIASDFIRKFKIGDLLKLESKYEYVICNIIYLNFYKSFEEMLDS
jgi:ASC-1-like (ASCH) protein